MTCKHEDIPDGLTIIDGCGCAVKRLEHNQVVYDYYKLILHLKEHESMIDPEDPEDYTVALEWVEYNVVGGLPNATPNPPSIEYDDDDDE